MTDVTSLDSGFDAMEGIMNNSEANIHIRVTMPEDPSFQMIFIISPVDLVWTLKQKVLDSVAKDLKDPLNYGLYCPPSNNRVGKYLDEERPIKEYPLSVPIGLLEFKYKKRLYKTDLNPLKLKKMHTPTELKIFMELVKRSEIDQITAKMSKGFDPNFNSIGKGETPMTLAATFPRPGAVILALVGGGAFVDYRNKNGLTPLHIATMSGNKDAVRILLDLGSSPNYKDSRGLTPLAYATMKDTPPLCIQWLLQERADIGRRDEKGWMEIHHACEQGLTQHLEQLLYYGADRNAATRDSNDTPLHLCAKFNQGDCARLLLLRGADKSLKNKSDQTPEQVARAAGHDNVAKCIAEFSPEQVELFSDVPKYNERRRGTISMATLRNLQRSRSNPNLLQQLFQQDPVLSATVSQATGVQYVSNGLIPNGVKSPTANGRHSASELFGTGPRTLGKRGNLDKPNRIHIERVIELHRPPSGYGFVLRGPIDPTGSTLNFVPTPDIPARQYIDSVDPGGAAERVGLEAGDFILEINGQNVIFESHKDCVQLMRNCGDFIKLKIVKVRLNEPQIQSAKDHNNKTSEDPTEVNDSVISNSLTSSGSNQAKAALAGLEALENLDATLDNYDGIVNGNAEDQVDIIPAEVHSEDLPLPEAPLSPDDDFLPPPPAYDDQVVEVEKVELEVPELLVKDDNDSLKNDHLEVITDGRVGRKLSEEKEVTVESSDDNIFVEKSDEGVSKKKSASLAFAATGIGLAQEKKPDDASRTSTLVKSAGTPATAEFQNKKKYPAPAVPQPSSAASPVLSSSRTTATSGIVIASVKSDETERKSNRSVSTHSEVSLAESAPAPPPPPPLPPPVPAGFVVGTLSRSKPSSESLDGEKNGSSGGTQRQLLEETRKREESHAALMAAVLKRKNILDATDSGQLADNIDARVDKNRNQQKTVYRGDKTKEIKSPPTTVHGAGLLVNAEGTLSKSQTLSKSEMSSVDDDMMGFSAEAEKIRQAFLLKKSTNLTSKEISNDGPAPLKVSDTKKTGEISFPGEQLHSPVVASVNVASNGAEVRTLGRGANRPASSAVTSNQPVLADVASIIAQKALERQKKEEANATLTQTKQTNSGDKAYRKSMFETSGESGKPFTSATLPKLSTSRVYTSGDLKIDEGHPGAGSVSSVKSPPAANTLQPKKYGSSVTVVSPSKVTSQASKEPQQNFAIPSNRNTTIFTSSATGKENTVSVVRSPRPGTVLSKQEVPDKTLPAGVIPPPLEFATPNEPSFSNDVYATATLRSVSKSTPSNSMVFRAKSSLSSEAVVAKSFQDHSIGLWNEKDIGDWLDSLDYSEYHAIFSERKITGSVLTRMKGSDLESMGISNPLHRIRIEKEIRKYLNKK